MKNTVPKICFILATAPVIAFVIKLPADYAVYSSTLNSAPFYLWIIVDAIYFLLPAGIIAAVGFILKRKSSKS